MKIPTMIAIALLIIPPIPGALAQEKDRVLSLKAGIPDFIDFKGYAGVAIGAVPEYEGSEDFATEAIPLFEIRQPDFLFLKGASVDPNDGLVSIGWNALSLAYEKQAVQRLKFSLGPLLRLYDGRDEGDSETLNGLGNIDRDVAFGGFIDVDAGPWSAGLRVVPRGDSGVLTTFGARYRAQFSDRLAVATGVSMSWADSDFMREYFGVTGARAARGGLAKFEAVAGVKDMGVQFQALYTLSANWLIDGQVGYRRLLNDAADSPITRDRGQFRALLGAAYRF